MALQTSGQITLHDIAFEFDDAAPHQLSEFYGAASGIPTSGEITLSDFYGATASFYNGVIDGSARFDYDSSAYLSRTPASAGNRKTWTLSGWYKYSNAFTNCTFADVTDGTTSNEASIRFDLSKKISFYDNQGGATKAVLVSNQVCRDTSAWYHVVLKVDTTQATASDRIKIWLNGEQITSWGTETYYAQNQDTMFSSANIHSLGIRKSSSNRIYDGYMAEVHFIDGTALDATSFGESKNGCWIPKAYSGSYGTNGFHLDFGQSLTADQSGNSNNFTANNMGSTDLVLDTPENNFATLNPVYPHNTAIKFREGNLKVFNNSAWVHATSTFAMNSGKWYMEYCAVDEDNSGIGILGENSAAQVSNLTTNLGWFGRESDGYEWENNFGNVYLINNGSYTAYGTAPSAGDIYMCAFDADNGAVYYGLNGTWFNSSNPATATSPAFSSVPMTKGYTFAISQENANGVANFGQDSSFAGSKTAQGNTDGNGYGDFYYTPPSGYLALCSANLPVATAVDPFAGNSPQDYFNTVLYTGDGTSPRSITGVGFDTDFTWIKNRSDGSIWHMLFDQVRGADRALFSNATNAEAYQSGYGYLDSFISDGFTLSAGATNSDNVNKSSNAYVAWNWKANGSGVSNTDGSITSTVSANTGAGFSIVSYTGNSTSGATVGHGLSSTPEMMIVKGRDNTENWQVWHKDLGSGSFNYIIHLNGTWGAFSGVSQRFQNASASTFTLGNDADINLNANDFIAYCFHSVEGFSKFGKYTGNGSSDGTFVYTGFRPAFVMIKRTNTSGNWFTLDAARDPENASPYKILYPNLSNAEDSSTGFVYDFVSNGFKLRNTEGDVNGSGSTMIYMAFAENPFKYANAR